MKTLILYLLSKLRHRKLTSLTPMQRVIVLSVKR